MKSVDVRSGVIEITRPTNIDFGVVASCRKVGDSCSAFAIESGIMQDKEAITM